MTFSPAGIAIIILLLTSIVRAISFMYDESRFQKNRENYISLLRFLLVEISQNHHLLEKMANQIDPVAGLGVESLWLTRVEDDIKDNNALEEIDDVSEFKFLMRKVFHTISLRPGDFPQYDEYVLLRHFQLALLQGWNGKEKDKPLFPELKKEIDEVIKSLKALVKKKFKELKKTESKKSIRYRYGVVFYRRYTFNLYKSVTGYFFISTLILIPLGLSILNERQPYFNTLDEVINDLNSADKNKAIHMGDFKDDISEEVDSIQDQENEIQKNQYEINRKYHNGKIYRTIMWILISLVSIPAFTLAATHDSFIGLFFLFVSIALLIHKVMLLPKLWRIVKG
jgi:hypothetical protein